MDAWRAKLAAARDRWQEDDEDDDFAVGWVIGLDLGSGSTGHKPGVQGGSLPGKAPNVERDRVDMHNRMMRDYFSDNPVYGPTSFRRRYRMRKELLVSIINEVCRYDSYFIQKYDACGLLGLSPQQKITSALRMLCYGTSGDSTDEYCRTSDSTALKCLRRFCKAIRAIFESYHLRQPTRADFDKHLAINERRGFPSMFGSLDCMHWEWKNCPVAWQGDFGDRQGKRSIILEAVATEDLHIWHIFFGLPGSNNDLNVLQRSPLVNNMLTSEARNDSYEINGSPYNRYYLLTDGIYPKWSCFVQSIHLPTDAKTAYFSSRQEAVRKDVERCFGVLQARFAIVKNPCRHWSMAIINDIMFTCVILHNMIVEDEYGLEEEDILQDLQRDAIPLQRGLTFDDYLRSMTEIESADRHYCLRADLVNHLWNVKGQSIY